MMEDFSEKQMLEALLFASKEALSEQQLREYLPKGTAINSLLLELQGDYATRGIRLQQYGDKWLFHTAPEAKNLLAPLKIEERRLSRAALEVLAIIAYHGPMTRAEIEAVRGVGVSRGTLDILMECEWIYPSKAEEGIARGWQWQVSDNFLVHFGLQSLEDLPGVAELRDTGFVPDMFRKFSDEDEHDKDRQDRDIE